MKSTRLMRDSDLGTHVLEINVAKKIINVQTGAEFFSASRATMATQRCVISLVFVVLNSVLISARPDEGLYGDGLGSLVNARNLNTVSCLFVMFSDE